MCDDDVPPLRRVSGEPLLQFWAMPGSAEGKVFLDPHDYSSTILLAPFLDGVTLGVRECLSDDADRPERFGTLPLVPAQEIKNHAGTSRRSSPA